MLLPRRKDDNINDDNEDDFADDVEMIQLQENWWIDKEQ
jgi:hypothetical protein